MKRIVPMIGILTSAVCCLSLSARAQCNPTCQGDFNLDGRVTVDEIIIAVNNALTGCSETAEQGCVDSGGTVSSTLCCAGVGDFPDTCAIGPCGCAPQFSSEVKICNCGAGTCFNPDQRACVPR